MDKTIYVAVHGKIATANKDALYICGNSDFVIEFDFDEEWEAFTAKTARFSYNGSYTDIVFSGTRCAVPVLSNIYGFKVGVFAGNLHTTTPAYVAAKKSILCEHGSPVEPEPDVYAQIMEEMNRMADSVGAEVKARLTALEESDETLADTDEELARRTAALEQRFEDMDYGNGIVINSFTHNQTGTKERGSVVTGLTLSWRFDRKPATQKLTGPTLDSAGVSPTISGKEYSYPISGVSINADNQGSFRWKIAATDNRRKAVSQTSPGFTFYNCVYYGAADEPEAIDSLFIRSLGTKTSPTSGKPSGINVNGGGKYIWYCLPTDSGTCKFKSNGFPAGIELVDTIAFTNALGYTEN